MVAQKKDNHSDDQQDHIDEPELTLEDKVEELLEGQVQADMDEMTAQFDVQQKEIEKLTTIAGQTQRQYVQLKMDFDAYQKRVDAQQVDGKRDALIDVVQKFLPAIDQLQQTVAHIPDDLEGNAWATGVQMVTTTMMKQLNEMGIYYVSYLHQAPMLDHIEPIGTEPVEDEDMKQKIVREVEQCVVYRDADGERVVRAAKVILGA